MKFLLLLLFFSSVLCETFPVPLFFWSGNARFSSQTEVAETMDVLDAQFLIQQIHGINSPSGKLSKFANKIDKPLSTVVFLEPKMRTDVFSQLSDAYGRRDGGSFSHLKKILTTSTSSLLVPYMTLESSFSESLLEILPHFPVTVVLPEAEISSHSLSKVFGESTTYVSYSTFLQSPSNHKFAIVGFSESERVDYSQHDELIEKISSAVNSASKGNFMGVFTADKSVKSDWKLTPFLEQVDIAQFLSARYAAAFEQSNGTTAPPSNTTYYDNHWPPAVWEGLLVSGMLLIILFIGMCCTFDIQVPKVFAIDHKKRD